MKYKCIKNFPGSTICTGEIDTAENLKDYSPRLYPEFFQLVEYNYEGRIIKVGDKVGDASICAIDYENKTVFLDNHDFMWMDKIPYYYSVVDWKIITHCGPPVIKTQFTSNSKEDAEKFVLMNYPCLSLANVNLMDSSRLESLVNARINERNRT